MKKKPGFDLRNVCGAYVIIATGMQNIDFSKLIALNDTSAFIWNCIPDNADFTIDELVEKLTDEYEVSADEAYADVTDFLNKLVENNVLER